MSSAPSFRKYASDEERILAKNARRREMYKIKKSSIRADQKEYYEAHSERIRQSKRDYRQYLANNRPEYDIFHGAKKRAKDKGLEFNLSIEDIIIPEICPILLEPLKRKTRYAPSLDRKDPTKGYTTDNIWVISRKANAMKQDATALELSRFGDWIKNS